MKQLLWTTLIVSFAIYTTCQKGDNPCKSKITCGECIKADSRCAWCSEEDFSFEDARCDFRDALLKKCHQNFIVFPQNTMKIWKEVELTDSGPNDEPIQVKPQHISITARPKSLQNINVYFRQAQNYPVDLYYLMDLSYTMKDDKEKLGSLGAEFANTMGKITTKFLLGFGSFVDKTALPFTDTAPSKLEQPCSNRDVCAKPYGFRNHISLNNSTSKFSSEIKDAPVSGNLDSPEGGFDAIMQVVVCKEIIGWRNHSRKLLVFATDSGFHYAGDGRLAGIIKPNDGKCHLDSSGYYTESLDQDYPSIRQLNQKIEDNNINVIFAVTDEAVDIYKDLTVELKGSTTGRLSRDSSNVIDLIKKQYDQIVSTIEMRDNADKDVRVTYYSQCLRQQREKTSRCREVKLGHNVTFDLEIEVISCPTNKKERKKQLKISPVGLNEALIIDLEIVCECDCEKEGKKEINSQKCSSGNGSFECGICNCYSNRYGKICQCDGTETNDASADSECQKDNSTKTCSQRGECRCGVCECKPRKDPSEKIYGKYCECDNFSCNKKDNLLCGGSDKGSCDCGVCVCNSGWKGSDCSCRDSEENCKSQDGKICSGHGTCKCNECKCRNEGEEFYSGFHCEECPTCPDKCNIYKSCVECHLSNSTSVEYEDTCSNCSLAIQTVSHVEANNSRERICTFPDLQNCRLIFKYVLNSLNQPVIHVQKERVCPKPLNAMAIGLGVAGGIIGIGLLLLLILKLLTSIHDQREWVKFEKDRQMAKWDEGGNPIYKQPTSTFMNPTFGN